MTEQDCVKATPHYRKDAQGNPRYLYLIHPTQADGSRKREYVGADEEKEAQALAALARYDEREQLRQALRQRQAAHRTALIQLRQALRTIEQGWAYEHH